MFDIKMAGNLTHWTRIHFKKNAPEWTMYQVRVFPTKIKVPKYNCKFLTSSGKKNKN